MPKIKVENLYKTAITSSLGIAASGDVSFTVTTAPINSNGFIVISPDSTTLREIMYYHDVIGNTIYVRAENRMLPKAHSKNELVQINDIAEIFNTYSDMISTCFYAEKTGWLTMKIWGGTVYYNWSPQTVADTNITLVNNTTNYVKYDFATNTISVDQTNSGNIKITIVTLSGVINSINYNVSKESLSTQGIQGIPWEQGPQGVPWVGLTDGDKWDITLSASATVFTIDNAVVTNAKMANMATKTYKGRTSALTWVPEDVPVATLKTDLNLTGTNSGDQTSIVGITGTRAQFDTAITDGNIMYIGDAPTAHNQTASTITDFASASRAQTEAELVAGSNITITPSGTGATRQLTIASTASGWGSGDVVWPASSTDNAIARMDSTTGKLIQNSVVTIDDAWAISWISSLSASTTINSSQSSGYSFFSAWWFAFIWTTYRWFWDDIAWAKLLTFPTKIASAINNFKMSNSITWVWPTLEVEGTDTNIDLNLKTKWTWVVKINWTPLSSWTWDVVWPASATDNAIARFDSTTGKLIQNWVITESDNGDVANINAIQMDITPTSVPTWEGVVSWNATEKTIDIQTWFGWTILQVWREMHMQVRNNTGSTITNWSVVYINGAGSGMPTVALAQANDYTKSIKLLWVATMDVPTASNGPITTIGQVHELNTSGFTVWDVLYLSSSVSWWITNVNPTGLNYTIEIGTCIVSHATTGIINVNIRMLRAIESDEFKVVDSTDKTKQAAFVVSGISSGTKRQFTLPNADTTLIGTTTTDTLTNKSISLGTNTVTSTKSQLNTAVTDGDVVFLDSADTISWVKTFLSWMMGLRNVANTFTSFFTNTNTASRTYTLQDRNGTLADNTDLALKANLASPTFTGTVTLPASQALVTPLLWTPTSWNLTNTTGYQDIKLARILPSTATDASTVTFDIAMNNKWQVTANVAGANRTLALSNTTNIPVFSINIKQDATWSRTVTWFSWITWAGWTVPTLTTTANKTDSFWFQQISAGVYLGCVILQNA